MSRSFFTSIVLSCLGLATLYAPVAQAGQCAVDCGAYGYCSISAKNAVKCKCTPFPVCKRITAMTSNTLDDFTTSAEAKIVELDELIDLAIDSDDQELVDALETIREALLAGDEREYVAGLEEYERLLNEREAAPLAVGGRIGRR